MPLISIIVRCFNEEKHIGRLLSGILCQSEQDVEIVVVDSGSTDNTVRIAEQFPINLVTIRPEEFSFGRSLNMGCEAASGKILVMASAHVYPVYGDWLSEMVRPFADPNIALVYGRQKGNEVTKYAEHQIFATWFPATSNFNQTHPFCNNANVAIRRELWELYPYNEELTGLEDIAWAKLIMAEGYKIAYNADAEIVHVHDESPARTYNRYRREAIALKQIFPEETFPFFRFFRLFVSNSLADYYHALNDQLLFKNIWSIPQFRLMQFWGTYRGYQQKNTPIDAVRQTLYYPRELSSQAAIDVGEGAGREPINYQMLPNLSKHKRLSSS